MNEPLDEHRIVNYKMNSILKQSGMNDAKRYDYI